MDKKVVTCHSVLHTYVKNYRLAFSVLTKMEEDTEAAKEARKKKIKELEASLFGNSKNNADIGKTDLPTLQNVDEFSAKFNMAEMTKKPLTALPRLKPKSKKNFLQKITQKKTRKTDGFDGIPLISDDEETSEKDEIIIAKVVNSFVMENQVTFVGQEKGEKRLKTARNH